MSKERREEYQKYQLYKSITEKNSKKSNKVVYRDMTKKEPEDNYSPMENDALLQALGTIMVTVFIGGLLMLFLLE